MFKVGDKVCGIYDDPKDPYFVATITQMSGFVAHLEYADGEVSAELLTHLVKVE